MTSVGMQIRPGPQPDGQGRGRGRASWHALANAVVLGWVVLTLAAVLVQDRLPSPGWLTIHLFLLGAITNAIVTWSEHFAIALLRLPAPARRSQAARLIALNTGVAAVLGGATGGVPDLAVAGAALVVGVVAWHVGVLLTWARRALGGRFAHVVAWYVWSGLALVTGGTLGGLMVSGRLSGTWQARMAVAHIHANLLGWVGLAVLGTLFTLWPTVLRTRMAPGSGAIARRSLRIAVPGLALAVTGLLTGWRWAATAGLLLYTAAAACALLPFVQAARARRPHTAAAWMLAAATTWFAVALATDAAVVATCPPGQAADRVESLVPFTLVGFAGQTLLGALTFLLPVVLGGGPAAVKRNSALLERGWTVRSAALNAAAALLALHALGLPAPAWLTRAGWVLLLVSSAAFVVLAVAAIARSRDLRLSPRTVGVAAGLLTVLAVLPAVSGRSGQPSPQAVARPGSRTVDIALSGMRIHPGTIEVAPGTRLTLHITNQDTQYHDLRLATGQHTPLLPPGQSTTLVLAPLTRPVEGWCTVPGHRAAGMTLHIHLRSAALKQRQPGQTD